MTAESVFCPPYPYPSSDVIFMCWVLVATVIIALVDVLLYLRHKDFNDTISFWIYTHAVQFPVVTVSLCLVPGFIIGHRWYNPQTVVEAIYFTLVGHFFWDQVLSVKVRNPGDSNE